jgi:TatD-related deoxyribonuclease|tara:strand:+ start:1063 stop:1971 length:909 start_codon:yes stop_codon:yes gene_type:complete
MEREHWREKMLENGIWTGPIMDQHIHLDRGNRFLSAIEEFSQSGGTGIMLVHKPRFSGHLPSDLDGYRNAYLETISMAETVRKKTGIEVGVVLGPHPVVWDVQANQIGVEESTELHIEAVGLALEMIESGMASCLGEVGRPHYQVDQERWDSANEVLQEIMSLAASEKVPIQLHVEDRGEETCKELAEMCDSTGLPRSNAIRHFSPPDISMEFTSGLSSTVNMGKGSVEGLVDTIANSKSRWGMETDFLDDPNRPGAVLGPKTVPKRTQKLCSTLLESGWEEEDVTSLFLNIHDVWPKELYS